VASAVQSACVQNVEEMAAYTKLQQRLTAERRAVAVLQAEALRERTVRTAAALDAATLPCPVGADFVVYNMRRPCRRGHCAPHYVSQSRQQGLAGAANETS
jgi:hypothetical protein